MYAQGYDLQARIARHDSAAELKIPDCRRLDRCPLPSRIVRIVLIAATLLIVAAIGFDYIAPYVLS